MKIFKITILCLLFVAGGLTFTSCGDSSANSTTEEGTETGPEYTSAYVCPMHCDGSGSDAAGTCPVCSMDYVKNEEHSNDGHTH